MRSLFLVAILCSLSEVVFGQQTGNINYEQLGISFTIPDGWVGQEAEEVYLISSYSQPGFMMLSIQEYASQEKMRQEMQAGYQEGFTTSLQPVGSVETIDQNTLGAEYGGVLEGQKAKAYVTGTINDFGQDVYIMAATTADLYSPMYKQLAFELEQSLIFSEVKPSQDWKNLLSNTKLTYMDSYSSTSYTSGGFSGGYSTEAVFDLCSKGYFNYYGSSNMSFGSDVSSGYSSDSGQGSGEWDVVGNTLQLKFRNGEVWEYELTMEDGKTFLNGYRYFRTSKGEYAPNCY